MIQHIIASVTKDEQIKPALVSEVTRVNLMSGNIMNLREVIAELHERGKMVYVHAEMVKGLGRDASAVQYLAEEFKADGIISTKSNMIVAAKNANLKTIQRIFAIDTNALETGVKMISTSSPDEVELMPGLMPRVIQDMKGKINKPLIVGGLIKYREEIEAAVHAGADYVSMGNPNYWNK